MSSIKSHTKEENYELLVKSGSGHALVIDEPESLGGQNKGMSPHDLLLAALAGCTSATLKMYSQHKEWDLKEVKTEIRFIDGETKKDLPSIERDIELIGNLDEAQRERLLDIANRCPVHKILTGELKIKSVLK